MINKTVKQKHKDMKISKYLVSLAVLLVAISILVSCKKKEEDEAQNYWVIYQDWREKNTAFFEEKYAETDAQGNLVYTRVTPTWDPTSTILMRWYNDRTLTADSMSPFSTSYVDVIYEGKTYEGVVFDDSFDNTEPADSIYRSKLSDNVKGWVIALTNMRVGDHCEVIIPQDCGYGAEVKSDILLPYTTLVFDIKFRGIPGLEKPVN